MVGKNLAHYEILEKIGAGGMGEVYKARDTKLGRTIAIKVLSADVASDPERRKRFEREARSIAALQHPNIVTIFSVEEADGHLFLTMELVDGKSISEELPSDGLPLEKFFKVAIPLAEAIHSAHTAGITHRDLKPANVMIDGEGRVKVLDFGLAKLLGSDDVAAPDARTVAGDPDTQEGRVLGTVPYMSPEQAEGKPVDHRSDIFSLGIVLYEMITGERPFKGDSGLSIMTSILRDTPSTVTQIRRHLPVQLGRIIQHCLEKDPRRRFQSALDVANELRSLRIEVSSATGSVESVSLAKTFFNKKVGISSAVAFVALVTLFVFNPFKVAITPDQNAEAGVNTLAIVYFDNIADPDDTQRYGEIIAELLITGLSESDHVRVVSSQRLYDILKQLGKEGQKQIDRSTATEVATKAQAQWMMQGRVLQSEPSFVITSQIVEVSSGNVLASQRITGRPGETIFALVDRITEETLSDLAVPVDEMAAPVTKVAEMSTSSEEAYRHYLQGLEYQRKLFRQEAYQAFKEATKADTTFAMAYLYLAGYAHGDEAKQALAAAVRHADRATSKEKKYIEIAQAWNAREFAKVEKLASEVLAKYPDDKYTLRQLQQYYGAIENDLTKAIDVMNRIIEVDPADKTAYNTLAYLYDRADEFDKSIWAINQYISLAPNEPNPYDSRGDLYAANGHLDQAIESYAKSVEIKPDFFDYASMAKLGHMYVFKGEYDKAAAEYRKMLASNDPRVRANARFFLVLMSTYRAQIADALRQIDGALATDELEGQDHLLDDYHAIKAYLLHEVGNDDDAVAEMRRANEIREKQDDGIFTQLSKAIGLTQVGRIDEAEAVLAPHVARVDSLRGIEASITRVAMGIVAFAKENYAEAVHQIELSDRPDMFTVQYVLGEAYLRAGRPQDAVGVLEDLSHEYEKGRLTDLPLCSRLYYHLGVAYQEIGRNSDAIEQLETFLHIWDKADPRLKELHDARERLEILKSSS